MPRNHCSAIALLLTLVSSITYASQQQADIDALQRRVASLSRQQNFPEAIAAATELLSATQRQFGSSSVEAAYALNSLGGLYFVQRRYNEAEPLLKEALRIRETASNVDKELIAISLDNLGQLQRNLNRFDEAEGSFRRSFRLFGEALGAGHADTVIAGRNLATLLQHTNRSEEGIVLLSSLLDASIRQRGPRTADAVDILRDRGRLNLAGRQPAVAAADLTQALSIAEGLDRSGRLIVDVLVELADVHLAVRDYMQAASVLTRAKSLGERSFGEGDASLFGVYSRLGWAKLQLSDATAAKPLLELAARSASTTPELRARALNNLALAHTASGEYGEARARLEQAIALNESLAAYKDLAANYNNLGAALERLGAADGAEVSYRRSIEISRSHADAGNLGQARINLALLLSSVGRRRDSLAEARSYQAAFELQLLDVMSGGSDQQRLAFLQSANVFSLMATIGDPDALADVVLQYKGAATDLRSQYLIKDSATQGRREAWQQWQQARRALTEYSMDASTHPGDAAKTALTAAPENRDRLVAELARAEAALAREGRVSPLLSAAGVDDLRMRIPSDTAVLEFIRYSQYLGKGVQEDRYGALVIQREGPVRWIPLVGARELELAIDTYSNIIRGKYEKSLLPSTLRGLHGLIVQPILNELPKSCHRLVISPDGSLNFVSFATLLSTTQRFLAEDYLITYVASARHLLRPTTISRKEMVVYADPTFRTAKAERASLQGSPLPGFSFPVLEPLRYTTAESNDIKKLAELDGWSVTVHTGPSADERSLSGVRSPGILHLATHGFLLNAKATELQLAADRNRGAGGVRPVARATDQLGWITSVQYLSAEHVALDDPLLRSAVALNGAQDTLEQWRVGKVPLTNNDGVLNGEEAAALNLQGTWLVTLSSCDSGLGEAFPGEGVFGLRRGFLLAGAANVLTTLWPVNDKATASLMTGFYTSALASGDASVALAMVQRELLRKLRQERGVYDAVRLAGAFVMTSQGPGTLSSPVSLTPSRSASPSSVPTGGQRSR